MPHQQTRFVTEPDSKMTPDPDQTTIYAIEYAMHFPPHGIDEETASDYYLNSVEAQEAAYQLALESNYTDDDIEIIQHQHTEICELYLSVPNGYIKVMKKSLHDSAST